MQGSIGRPHPRPLLAAASCHPLQPPPADPPWPAAAAAAAASTPRAWARGDAAHCPRTAAAASWPSPPGCSLPSSRLQQRWQQRYSILSVINFTPSTRTSQARAFTPFPFTPPRTQLPPLSHPVPLHTTPPTPPPERLGVSEMPASGNSAPAASGRPTRLYPAAHHMFCLTLRSVARLSCSTSSTCGRRAVVAGVAGRQAVVGNVGREKGREVGVVAASDTQLQCCRHPAPRLSLRSLPPHTHHHHHTHTRPPT